MPGNRTDRTDFGGELRQPEVVAYMLNAFAERVSVRQRPQPVSDQPRRRGVPHRRTRGR